MKIKAAEKIVAIFGGNYSYSTLTDSEFIDYYTEKPVLFPDDGEKICRLMKNEGFEFQFYVVSSNGIKLCFIRMV